MAKLSISSIRNSGRVLAVLGRVKTRVAIRRNDVAIGGNSLRNVGVSTQGVPSLIPVVSITTTTTGSNRAIVANTRELGVGRSSELATICRDLGTLKISVSGASSKLIVGGANVINNNTIDNCGSRHVIVTLSILSTISDNSVVLHKTRTMGGSCPGFFRSFSSLKNDCGIVGS